MNSYEHIYQVIVKNSLLKCDCPISSDDNTKTKETLKGKTSCLSFRNSVLYHYSRKPDFVNNSGNC